MDNSYMFEKLSAWVNLMMYGISYHRISNATEREM